MARSQSASRTLSSDLHHVLHRSSRVVPFSLPLDSVRPPPVRGSRRVLPQPLHLSDTAAAYRRIVPAMATAFVAPIVGTTNPVSALAPSTVTTASHPAGGRSSNIRAGRFTSQYNIETIVERGGKLGNHLISIFDEHVARSRLPGQSAGLSALSAAALGSCGALAARAVGRRRTRAPRAKVQRWASTLDQLKQTTGKAMGLPNLGGRDIQKHQ